MSDWLSKRLTPSKSREERWTEFAAVLEHVWEEFFDPDMSRLERMRSSYTADDADLIKKIREMGDYFIYDWPKKDNRPIALSWRRQELDYKDLELILNSNIRRHFNGLTVAWLPIFAPKDQIYGIGFRVAEGPIPKRQLVPPEGMFLTSRGRLGVDFGDLMRIGMSRAQFRDKGVPIVRRVKPLHIVFEGLLWYIYFELPFECFFDNALWESEDRATLYFAPFGSRYDFTPDAVRRADTGCIDCPAETDWLTLPIPFIPEDYAFWRLDIFPPMGLTPQIPMLDFVLPGYEGMPLGPICFVPREGEDKFQLAPEPFAMSISGSRNKNPDFSFLVANSAVETCGECDELVEFNIKRSELRLDQHPMFDEMTADFSPLDYPYGGDIYA